MKKKINNFIYSWFKNYYIKLIDIFNKKRFRISNFIIKYSCNLNIDFLIFSLVKWFFCINKKKYIKCNKCLNCILLKKNNYYNYYYINNDVNIDSIKKIYKNLLSNLNINKIKIIYFSNFKFKNNYVNNFLLKILENNDNKFIFIFSCLDNIIIPNTILSRSFIFKVNFPKEKNIFNFLNNYKKKYNKNILLSSIRLSNNSITDTLIWIKKKNIIKKNIIKLILNLNNLSIHNIVNMLNNNNLEINLYILITFFMDYIKYKYKIKKYLYNLDLYFIFKYKIKNINIYNIYLILNKIIICLNNIKYINNINKNILLYDLVNFLLIKFNFGN